jgi:putative transposase
VRNLEFSEGEYYHVYNRGTEKRTIFLDEKDHRRFLQCLHYLNNKHFVPQRADFASPDFLFRQPTGNERSPLVELLSWCLMPNHFHLLLTPLSEGGVSRFMLRVLTSYSKYFNVKYDRSGRLFEGTFKAKHVDKDEYLNHVSRYIHLNPLKLKIPNWQNGGAADIRTAVRFLEEEYKWSSFRDYIGQGVFPELVMSDRLIVDVGGREEYREFVYEWLQDGVPEGYRETITA